MAHSLFLGMTESGKTSLAVEIAKQWSAAGFNVLVLDPMRDPSWPADFITDDPDEFLRVYWDNQRCAVFIDEAGESTGHYDKAMVKTATRGRHWGHSNHYISQRAAMLSTTVRTQCSNLFLFSMNPDDCKAIAKDFNDQTLLEGSGLQKGEYLFGGKFKPFKKARLF